MVPLHGKLILGAMAEKTAVDSVEEERGREVVHVFVKKIHSFLLQVVREIVAAAISLGSRDSVGVNTAKSHLVRQGESSN